MHKLSALDAAGLLFMVAASSTTLAADPVAIATQGSSTLPACASCHGMDGGGQASFPRLAGMNAAYLLKQMQDFASDSRTNAVMQPIAKTLSPADRAAMADYYAALPIPSALAKPAPPAPGSGDAGARLATRGKWSQGVPACVQCHGPGGVGVGDNFPSIAGQPASYIAAQLRAWQAGTRKNDPLELMRHLSTRLTTGEITAVSEWFARQPAVATGAAP